MTPEFWAGVVALIAVAIPIGKILYNLAKTLTRLDVTLTALNKAVCDDSADNIKAHDEFRGTIKDHEGRIIHLEERIKP